MAEQGQDEQLQEALRRSLAETTHEESQLADALAASLTTHDEELARAMQREQLLLHETDLLQSAQNVPSHPPIPSNMGSPVACPHMPVLSSGTDQAAYLEAELLGGPTYTHTPSKESGLYSPSSSESKAANGQRQYASVAATIPTYMPPSLRTSKEASVEGIALQPDLRQPLVVVDGQNVGCSFSGARGRFRAHGVEVVLDYYSDRGIAAIAMLPRCKVDTRPSIVNDRVADNPSLLNRLEQQGRLVFTPAGAHDDHFLLGYAMNKAIDIVSNDRFRKEVKEQASPEKSRIMQAFLDEHLIPYTFVHGEFMPNPNFSQLGSTMHQSRRRRR